MQPLSGVVNEDGNEISLNSDPRIPSCKHPELLEACDATHCHPWHYIFLTMFNPDDSVHIQTNLQLILQAGSYQTVSHNFLRYQHLTPNAFFSCIIIIILSENQPRISNIFILITLSSIFIAMGLMTLLGNEVVITHDFPEIIGKKYFTVGREPRSSDNNYNICSTVLQYLTSLLICPMRCTGQELPSPFCSWRNCVLESNTIFSRWHS